MDPQTFEAELRRLEARVRQNDDDLRDIDLEQRRSLERIRILRATGAATFVGASTDGGGGGSASHLLGIFSQCYGNPPVAVADVFLYSVRQNPAAPSGWEYYLIAATTVYGGQVTVYVPDYPDIVDGGGTPVPTAVPKVVVLSTTYDQATGIVDRDAGPVNVYLPPLGYATGRGWATAPAVIVVPGGGFGSGARIGSQPASATNPFPVLFTGSGYNLSTTIALAGYYGTGWGVVPEIGVISGGTIDDPGSGLANGTYADAALPIGHDATIRGVAGNAHGIPSWSIVDGGSCMGADGALVTFSIPAPGGVGAKRTPSVTGTVSGGAVAGLQVWDPGIAGSYASGVTVTGTATQQGAGGTIGYRVSGGQISSITGVTAFGRGYYLGAKSTPPLDGVGPFANGKITPAVIEGIGQVDQVTPPDLYGCYGNIGSPAKITAVLSSQFGATRLRALFDGFGAWTQQTRCTQAALGQVINNATSPNSYYANPAYYPVRFTLSRDATAATITYKLTFTGGVLTGVTIVNAGYGYAIDPSILVVGFPDFRTGSTPARFHFTRNGSGGANGYAIDVAGGGYQTTLGATLNGTFPAFGVYSVFESPGATWLLTCAGDVTLSDVDGKSRPNGGFIGTDTLVTATVGPSSYSGLPLAASYDFSGTSVDGPIFQAGSKVVTLDGS